jgi:hypothetical protein
LWQPFIHQHEPNGIGAGVQESLEPIDLTEQMQYPGEMFDPDTRIALLEPLQGRHGHAAALCRGGLRQ